MSKGSGGTKSVAISINKFKNHVVEYVRDNTFGSFEKKELSYMKSNFKQEGTLYRIIDDYFGDYTTKKKGDEINIDRLVSFATGLDGLGHVLDLNDFPEEESIVLKIKDGKGFSLKNIVKENISEFGPSGRDYVEQNEVLANGKYKIKNIEYKNYNSSKGSFAYRLKTITLEEK